MASSGAAASAAARSASSSQLSQLTLPQAQRRPCSDALREQQCLDPVLDAQLLLHEALALAVRSLAVLLLGCRHAHHARTPVCHRPARPRARAAYPQRRAGRFWLDASGGSPGYWSARARRQVCRAPSAADAAKTRPDPPRSSTPPRRPLRVGSGRASAAPRSVRAAPPCRLLRFDAGLDFL